MCTSIKMPTHRSYFRIAPRKHSSHCHATLHKAAATALHICTCVAPLIHLFIKKSLECSSEAQLNTFHQYLSCSALLLLVFTTADIFAWRRVHMRSVCSVVFCSFFFALTTTHLQSTGKRLNDHKCHWLSLK